MQPAVHTIGFWSGLFAFSATISYCVVQLLQVYGVFTFPLDEILIYGTSLCIVIPFLMEMLAVHYTTPPTKKFWSHAALLFTCFYAVFVTANYVVQLATVIPQTMQGRANAIEVLRQTPHSLFWDFDALGYIFMGLATAVSIPVFEKTGFQKWVRIALLANASVTPLISIVYFSPGYSNTLLMLGYPWAVTAPACMLLLAIHLRKSRKKAPASAHKKQAVSTGKRPIVHIPATPAATVRSAHEP